MSHYLEGKIALKCSIDLLRRALIGIMPTWEKHIVVDTNGGLIAYGYGGKVVDNKTFHVIVPGPRNPNHSGAPDNSYADIALKREADGTWSVMADHAGLRKVRNLEEQLKGELMRMKVKAWAMMNPNVQILKNVSNEEESYMDISVDSEQAKKILMGF